MAPRSSFVNFAYGSNMLRARIAERVPSARVIGPAILHGHVLRWHKAGRDRSGKCDVVADPAPDAAVHGVLYEIATAEKAALDRAEGLGAGYEEQTVQVEYQGKPVSAHLYRASHIDAGVLPYSWYKALVVAGAWQHWLPAAYIEMLEAVATIEDADTERHAANMALSRNRL